MATTKKKSGLVTNDDDESDDDYDDNELYGGSGESRSKRNLTVDEVELAEKAMEAQRQTQWVQKTAKDLQRRLDVEKRAGDINQRNKLQENANLISECNTLRRENFSIKREKDILLHELMDMKERYKGSEEVSVGSLGMGSAVGDDGKRSEKNTGQRQHSSLEAIANLPAGGYPQSESPESPPVTGQQMKVSKTLSSLGAALTGDITSGGGLGWDKASKGVRSRGTRGGESLRKDNIMLQRKLDERQRETEMQRIEISRLRETIRSMAMEEKKVRKVNVLEGNGNFYRNLEEKGEVQKATSRGRGAGSAGRGKLVVSGGGARLKD